MKIKNLVIYNDNQDILARLAEEYKMIGYDVKCEEGRLTVFCLKQKRETRREVQEARKNGPSKGPGMRSGNKVLASR